jgi:hygromycin-B 7''-O-kinase
VTEPPAFASLDDYRSRLPDADVWWPYLSEILARHDLTDPGSEPIAGYNATWPTFVYGDTVVKLFGFQDGWKRAFAAERAALALVGDVAEIAAPRLIGEGQTFDGPEAWPFLLMSRVPGRASEPDRPAPDAWPSIAAELGHQVRSLHQLEPAGIATAADWPEADVASAARRSSLPPHLAQQAAAYVEGLPPFDDVVVHGDLVAMHVFVEDGRVTGLIDWADALVTDRHYELAQLFRDTFDCDKGLLRTFLDASDWPVGEDFPQKVMGHALRRQALMLAQHASGDVFMPIAERFPLDEIATLDELADELFIV